MIDMAGYDSADIYTVWLQANGNISGLAYVAGYSTVSTPSIYQITCQVIPTGRPFIYMFRSEVPEDYQENPEFAPDWENPDGYGGCTV